MSESPKIEDALKTAQSAMQAGDFDRALASLVPILDALPDHTDALYMKAASLRYLGRLDDALSVITHLRTLAPDFGRGLQEEGHLFRARGDQTRALTCYQSAVRANPGLHAAWFGQADILSAQGHFEAAKATRLEAQRVKTLPPQILAAMHHLYENRFLKAETVIRNWLQSHPRDIEAMRLLAEIGNRLGVLDDAEFVLESAVEFEPNHKGARLDYIRILRKRQKFQKAVEHAEFLHNSQPDNPAFMSQLAIERMQTGDYEAALDLFDKVLQIVPNDPASLTSRGHALKTWGRSDDAIQSYRAAVEAKPSHGDAWYALANLKTYHFNDDEVSMMRTAEAVPGQALDNQINFCFALGKASEDQGDIKAAFAYYERGNAFKTLQTRYTSEQMEAELNAQREFCTAQTLKTQIGKGHSACDPIFIVGLPRAGSTLLEQILASHSQVDGTLELPNIIAISQSLRGRDKVSDRTRYPHILSQLDGDTLTRLGQRYLDETMIHRKGAPFFTDKMPNNFRHIALIKLILPNAKIIDARREPIACCFSGFKQLFAEGQEFTYGLDEIGRYYRAYVDVMDHWDQVFPGQILRVIYEDMVRDTQAQIRRVLDFCGLDFEPACIEFHKNEREVRTASSEQVRQPINEKGLEAWKPFEPYLDPLKSALEPVLTDYRRDRNAASLLQD